MRPWIAAVLVAAASSSPAASAAGQTAIDPDYLALVRQYAAGDIRAAAAALVAWPQNRARTASRLLRTSGDRQAMRTALMLHTDVALITPNDRLASFHVGLGETFLPNADADRDRILAARWHAWAAILYTLRRNVGMARRHINLSIGLDARNKDAQLVRGILEEISVRDIERNVRGKWNVEGSTARWETRLTAASLAYRAALESDPQFGDARVRLGWVFFLNHSEDRARDELQHALASTRGDVRYLAHLFLGGIHERAKQLDLAFNEYAAAHAIYATQTTYAAIMQVESMRGHDDQVRALARQFGAGPPGADPWIDFSAGITSGELPEWLRLEAIRQ